MPASHEYYPSPSAALGLPASAFTSLYPQGYFGHSLSGHPVFISKPSAMDARAVDACLSLVSCSGVVVVRLMPIAP